MARKIMDFTQLVSIGIATGGVLLTLGTTFGGTIVKEAGGMIIKAIFNRGQQKELPPHDAQKELRAYMADEIKELKTDLDLANRRLNRLVRLLVAHNARCPTPIEGLEELLADIQQ